MRRLRVLAGAGWGAAAAALLVAIGGTAIAGPIASESAVRARDLARGSVTSSKIRNGAVTRTKIRNRAVTAAKLGNSSVRSQQILDNSVTGADVNEATLGAVPAAILAGSANALGGRPASDFVTASEFTRFAVRLAAGETRRLAANGNVFLDARCRQNDDGGFDFVEILAGTTATNAFLAGVDTLNGGPATGDFLQPDTSASARQLLARAQATGQLPEVDNSIDSGFVMGADGSYLGIDGESTALGLNALGAKCVAIGTIVSHTAG